MISPSKHMKTTLRNTFISGLGFGLGFILGSLISRWIYGIGPIETLFRQLSLENIIGFLLLVIVALMILGGVAGAIGGVGLSMVDRTLSRGRIILSSGFSTAISFGLVLFVMVLALDLIGFFNSADELINRFIPVITFFSAIFGLLAGLLLGLLTVGRRFLWVTLASTLGFGLGGIVLGYGLQQHLFESTFAELASGSAPRMVLWLFLFGLLGGGALGLAYSWLAARPPRQTSPVRIRPKKPLVWLLQIGLWVALVLIGLVAVIRVFQILQPKPADLAEVISTDTVGSHWSAPATLAGPETRLSEPAIAANGDGQVATTWSQGTDQGTDIYFAARQQTWSEPVSISNSPDRLSTNPQLALDESGTAHIVWTEAGDRPDETGIYYSQCKAGACSPPAQLSDLSALTCADTASASVWPTIAIDRSGTRMVVWGADAGPLLYSTWSTSESPPSAPTGCVGNNLTLVSPPRLTALAEGEFVLVFDRADGGQAGQVYRRHYGDGNWASEPELVGQGSRPEVFADQAGQVHMAWCGVEGQLRYHRPGGETEAITFPGCSGRPGLAVDSQGLPHLVWYADEVENVAGNLSAHQLLYESIRQETGWSEPAIVSQTGRPSQVGLTGDGAGTLHLAWNGMVGEDQSLNYATQVQYACPDTPSSPVDQAVLDVADQGGYRPPGETIPYCHNEYKKLVMSPNPAPPLVATGAVPAPDGPFDDIAELVEGAQYEVLFAVMFYDSAENNDSPGYVLAQAVARLYQLLKANPAQYPRGLTVRILLGNPPEPFHFELGNQLWHVIRDLREAGVPELVNPELGWKVEVANFAGAWPHSHTKFVVLDGKMAAVFGFNYQYIHFPKDHRSGRGNERVDPGILVAGPVAQAAQSVFDDMWRGARQRHCTNLNPPLGFWDLSCRPLPAIPDHVPEVKKYFIPEKESNAFSLYRSEKYREADEALAAAIASAQTSIDIFEINFTLQFVCDFTPLIGDFCTFEHAPDYMQALMAAVAENKARARILIFYDSIQALENEVALRVLEREFAARGVSDLVEVRYYNDGDMHSKSFLIDDEFVVIGSQNFHYSAWGDGALTEYNLGTDDPNAASDFRLVFEYYWDRAVPRESSQIKAQE